MRRNFFKFAPGILCSPNAGYIVFASSAKENASTFKVETKIKHGNKKAYYDSAYVDHTGTLIFSEIRPVDYGADAYVTITGLILDVEMKEVLKIEYKGYDNAPDKSFRTADSSIQRGIDYTARKDAEQHLEAKLTEILNNTSMELSGATVNH